MALPFFIFSATYLQKWKDEKNFETHWRKKILFKNIGKNLVCFNEKSSGKSRNRPIFKIRKENVRDLVKKNRSSFKIVSFRYG